MRFFAAILSLAVAASAAPASRRQLPSLTTTPSNDPFYKVPANVATYKPGDVIASRSVVVSLSNLVPLALTGVTSYQVLYRTTDALGNATATVATILIPPAQIRVPNTLVGYASAEDSAFLDCAPSATYTLLGSSRNSITSFEEYIFYSQVAQGHVAVSADYEGPFSTFAAGRMAGHGVLDSLRAAINFKPTNLTASTVKVAQFGYSGGAIAAGWASALQPSYAPELNVVGFAYGGTPANVSQTLQFLDGGLFAGFGAAGIAGLIYAYPQLQTLFNAQATQAGKDAIAYARSHCGVPDDIMQFAGQTIQSYKYTNLGPNLLSDPTVQSVTNQNILAYPPNLPKELPSAPLFIYHSNTDEIIPISGATTMVNRWCAAGVKSLEYHIDIGPSEHASLEVFGVVAVSGWINGRLNGTAPVKGCVTTQEVFPVPNANDLGPSVAPILGALINSYQSNIGQGDSQLKKSLGGS